MSKQTEDWDQRKGNASNLKDKENAPDSKDPVQRKRKLSSVHPRPVPHSRLVPHGQEPSSSTPSLLKSTVSASVLTSSKSTPSTAAPSAKVAVTQSAAAATTADPPKRPVPPMRPNLPKTAAGDCAFLVITGRGGGNLSCFSFDISTFLRPLRIRYSS